MIATEHKFSPADDIAWNRFGIVLASREGDLRGALPAFIHAHEADPLEARYLFNLGLALTKLGYKTDAVECLREALQRKPDHARATKKLAQLEPAVIPSDRFLEQHYCSDIVTPRSSEHLNIFELLDYRIESLRDWNDDEARYRKRKLLAELKLNDGQVPWMQDVRLEESAVRRVLDEIDSPQLRRYHHLLYSHRDLLRFLTHGDLTFFRLARHPRCVQPGWFDEDFQSFLGLALSSQINRVLRRAVERGEALLVMALVARHLPIPKALWENCFGGAYQLLQKIHAGIEQQITRAETSAEAMVTLALDGDLDRMIQPDAINALPAYFQDVRTSIAKALRSAAITCNNKHGDYPTAITILTLADTIKVDDSTARQLTEDHQAISANLLAAKAHDVDLCIGKHAFQLRRGHLVWKDKQLNTDAIRGLRWGIFKQYTNGMRTKCSYLVSMGTKEMTVNIECHLPKLFDWGKNEAASRDRFERIIHGCMIHIAPTIIERICETIRKGGTVNMGHCWLKKQGIAFSSGVLLWRRDHVVAWNDARCSTDSGQVTVSSKQNPSAKTSLSMRDIWNAVFLDLIVDSIAGRAHP